MKLLCLSLIENKKQYYKNLDIKKVTDHKKSFINVKSHFGKNDSNSEKIMLLENKLIKTNEKEIATMMNNFFINTAENLDLNSPQNCTTKDLNSIVSEFDDHISIKIT